MRRLKYNMQSCPACHGMVKIDAQKAAQEEQRVRGFPAWKTTCPHCEQPVLLDLHWEEVADTILKLRPQHAFCECFLETWYADQVLMVWLARIRRIIRCETDYVVMVVPMGEEDELCKRCPDLEKGECQHRLRWELAAADAAILSACQLNYGHVLTLEHIRELAKEHAPMKYCINCPFRKSHECSVAVRRYNGGQNCGIIRGFGENDGKLGADGRPSRHT